MAKKPRDRNPHPLTSQRMAIRPDDPGLPGGPDREAIIRQDTAFRAAMWKAMEARGKKIPPPKG